MTAADAERFMSPPSYDPPAEPVPQPPIDPSKPQMGYPRKELEFMVALSDAEVAAAASTPDPPVRLEQA